MVLSVRLLSQNSRKRNRGATTTRRMSSTSWISARAWPNQRAPRQRQRHRCPSALYPTAHSGPRAADRRRNPRREKQSATVASASNAQCPPSGRGAACTYSARSTSRSGSTGRPPTGAAPRAAPPPSLQASWRSATPPRSKRTSSPARPRPRARRPHPRSTFHSSLQNLAPRHTPPTP
ncbi:hypothetical protein B0H11DRAFT_2009233 [Mycena galericulata]|nr:hypothetical protein B0H11DRAFT_2009233 [Mycena galericulata]